MACVIKDVAVFRRPTPWWDWAWLVCPHRLARDRSSLVDCALMASGQLRLRPDVPGDLDLCRGKGRADDPKRLALASGLHPAALQLGTSCIRFQTSKAKPCLHLPPESP